jgi:hypothetical protein
MIEWLIDYIASEIEIPNHLSSYYTLYSFIKFLLYKWVYPSSRKKKT